MVELGFEPILPSKSFFLDCRASNLGQIFIAEETVGVAVEQGGQGYL